MLRVQIFLLLAATASAASATEPSGLHLVEAFNSREIGEPGWRRVELELRDGGRLSRSFTVVNLWQRRGGEVRTLFVLEQPHSLRGTNYLLVERSEPEGEMEVHLHLPAGRRGTLAIQPSRFEEGLLGSDFSYRDMRRLIPRRGYSFRNRGHAELGGRRVHVVDALPVTAQALAGTSWARVRYFFDRDAPLLVGADYFREGDERPSKRLRVETFRRIDGVWTETRMVMHAGAGRSSVLTLHDFAPRLSGFDEELLSPSRLPSLGKDLSQLDVRRDRPEPAP